MAPNSDVDQSHLHRDALDVAGRTPAAVADAPWLSVDEIAWPGSSRYRVA